MIITFSTRSRGDVTYVGDVALELLRLMGRSDTIPSAMYAEDIPEALRKLKVAVEQDEQVDADEESVTSDESDEPPVGLAVRALPLIELLEVAQRENELVSWK